MARTSQSLSRSTLELDAMARDLITARAPGPSAPYPVKPEGHAKPGRSLLLTGGAGFLGVHLLAQLALSPEFERIYVIVRKASKLPQQLLHYGIGAEALARVSVIEGGLCSLPQESFPAVDVVLHSAARIHCLQNLKQLWQDNVVATDRIFSLYYGRAQLHLVSTLSVFVSSNQEGGHLAAEVPVSGTYLLHGGYAQSKYICERLARAAGAHVIRLGLLTGASTTGKFPPGDFFSTVLQTLRHLSCSPSEYTEAQVDVTPVDFAAERIVQLLAWPVGLPPITHIANPEAVSLTQVLAAVGAAGTVPVPEYCARLVKLPRMQQVLMKYAFFKPAALQDLPDFFNVDLFQTTNHSYGPLAPFPLPNADLLSLYTAVAGAPRGPL